MGALAQAERLFAHEYREDRDIAGNPYFRPVDGGADRFGNYFYPSLSHLSYKDSNGWPLRAGLLISPRGRSFIQKHRETHMLHIIEDLTQQLFYGSSRVVSTENGISMERFRSGDYSMVFKCNVGDKNYAIKIAEYKPGDAQRTYHRYMLQLQALTADLGEEMSKLGIAFPAPLFASNAVYVEEFINGEWPDETIRPRLNKAYYITDEYVEEQRHADPRLWNRVRADREPRYLSISNGLVKDGVFYWVDPLDNY